MIIRKKVFLSVIAAAIGLAGCTSQSGNLTNNNRTNENREASNAFNTAANLSSGNTNSAPAGSTQPAGDNAFLIEAARGGLAEVELGKIASTKAANAEVKQFAEMMVKDHSSANAELKDIASKKGVTLPAQMDPAHQAKIEELRGKVGAEFDRSYIEAMVEAHEKDVAEFERQSTSASDPEVKAFAAKTLPVLKKHLESVKAIHAKM